MLLGTLLAWLAVSVIHHTIGNYISHSDCATSLDFVTALWVAWPFYSRAWEARKAFLHPPVRRYKMPLKHAFGKVREILSNTTYNFGDKWYVSTADTMQKRITACLRFTDEEHRLDLSSPSNNARLRRERKQRLLELEVQMEEEADDNTLIQLDFRTTVEGVSWHACDRIVYLFLEDVQTALGPGETMDPQMKSPVQLSPPWWLIILSVICLFHITVSVGSHISDSWQRLMTSEQGLRPSSIAFGVSRTGAK